MHGKPTISIDTNSMYHMYQDKIIHNPGMQLVKEEITQSVHIIHVIITLSLAPYIYSKYDQINSPNAHI